MTEPDDSTVRFACPRCLTRLKASLSQVGTKRRCPRCHRVFEVPTAAQVARRQRDVGEYHVSEGMGPSPAEAQPHVTFTCPICSTSLRATLDQVGQRLVCPDCETAVIVPPPVPVEHKRSLLGVPVEQYALCDEVDESTAGRRPAEQTYVAVTCPVCGTFMQVLEDLVGQEIVCPDCREPMLVSRPIKAEKKETPPAAELEEYALHEEAEAATSEAPGTEQTLFPLHCPLCDALMYAGREQVGLEIVCRDCGDYFVVPPPPAAKRKLDLRSQAGEVYGVSDAIEVPEHKPLVLTPQWRLRPGTGSAADRPSRGRLGPSGHRRGTMRSMVTLVDEPPKAADLGRHRTELRCDLAPPPATRPPPRWTFFSGVFTFPGYRASWPRWVGLSLGLIVPLWVGRVALALAMTPAGPWGGAIPWISAMVLFGVTFVCGSIWIVVASAQWLSIVRDTADGCDQIHNWPEALFLDWIGESFFLATSLTVSALPGLVLARVLESAGVPAWLPVSVGLLLTFPILLLAMLETNSPLNPFSLPVWRTLVTAWWAWGLFYIETTALIAAAGGLTLLAVSYVPIVGIALAAPLLVAAVMIYARLLGRLAWRCARVAPRDKRQPTDSAPSADQQEQ